MNENLKVSLMELIIGLREPESGLEIHFLKVLKNQARACTLEEKDWYEWWLSIQEKTSERKTLKQKVTQEKTSNLEILPIRQSQKTKAISTHSKIKGKIPARAQKILDSFKKNNGDSLMLSKRLSGSFGSGKKSR